MLSPAQPVPLPETTQTFPSSRPEARDLRQEPLLSSTGSTYRMVCCCYGGNCASCHHPGARMSGICMAIKLQDAGIDSFVIYEQASEIGGTWRDNTYPEFDLRRPVALLPYSFRPNPEWSRLTPPRREIQSYFLDVVEERKLRSHIRFNTPVDSAFPRRAMVDQNGVGRGVVRRSGDRHRNPCES